MELAQRFKLEGIEEQKPPPVQNWFQSLETKSEYPDPQIDLEEKIDRRLLRFMGDGAAYAYIAMQQAIADSGLEEEEVSNFKTGLVAGSGGPSTSSMLKSFDIAREKNPKRVGPYMVPRCMSSTVSANLANSFKISIKCYDLHIEIIYCTYQYIIYKYS